MEIIAWSCYKGRGGGVHLAWSHQAPHVPIQWRIQGGAGGAPPYFRQASHFFNFRLQTAVPSDLAPPLSKLAPPIQTGAPLSKLAPPIQKSWIRHCHLLYMIVGINSLVLSRVVYSLGLYVIRFSYYGCPIKTCLVQVEYLQ